MKYIIADKDDNKITIEKVTDDPIEYILRFEPIDIIGHTVVWDEKGDYYNVSPDKKIDVPNPKNGVSIVNVGKWDVEAEEPRLVKIAESRTTQLRHVLLAFLQEAKLSGGFFSRFFRKKEKLDTNKFDNCSLDELIEMAQKKLG